MAQSSTSISFRCTGCRCRIHVPQRRAGSTVPCPRCGTRVVVPAASEVADATRFEGRDVERSLAALQRTAGGTFADDSFEVPTAGESPSRDGPGVAKTPGVTLPRWAIYAVALALPVVAVVAFLCGCLWASTGRW